jgi:hypothetical protein
VVDDICAEWGAATSVEAASLLDRAKLLLSAADIQALDKDTDWHTIAAYPGMLVVVDLYCPKLTPEFVRECVNQCLELALPVVGATGITDTARAIEGGWLGQVYDRTTLRQVCGPIVMPCASAAMLDSPPSGDLACWLQPLLSQVCWLEPPLGVRRVAAPIELAVIELGPSS